MLSYDRIRQQEALTEEMVNEGRCSEWPDSRVQTAWRDASLNTNPKKEESPCRDEANETQ